MNIFNTLSNIGSSSLNQNPYALLGLENAAEKSRKPKTTSKVKLLAATKKSKEVAAQSTAQSKLALSPKVNPKQIGRVAVVALGLLAVGACLSGMIPGFNRVTVQNKNNTSSDKNFTGNSDYSDSANFNSSSVCSVNTSFGSALTGQSVKISQGNSLTEGFCLDNPSSPDLPFTGFNHSNNSFTSSSNLSESFSFNSSTFSPLNTSFGSALTRQSVKISQGNSLADGGNSSNHVPAVTRQEVSNSSFSKGYSLNLNVVYNSSEPMVIQIGNFEDADVGDEDGQIIFRLDDLDSSEELVLENPDENNKGLENGNSQLNSLSSQKSSKSIRKLSGQPQCEANLKNQSLPETIPMKKLNNENESSQQSPIEEEARESEFSKCSKNFGSKDCEQFVQDNENSSGWSLAAFEGWKSCKESQFSKDCNDYLEKAGKVKEISRKQVGDKIEITEKMYWVTRNYAVSWSDEVFNKAKECYNTFPKWADCRQFIVKPQNPSGLSLGKMKWDQNAFEFFKKTCPNQFFEENREKNMLCSITYTNDQAFLNFNPITKNIFKDLKPLELLTIEGFKYGIKEDIKIILGDDDHKELNDIKKILRQYALLFHPDKRQREVKADKALTQAYDKALLSVTAGIEAIQGKK